MRLLRDQLRSIPVAAKDRGFTCTGATEYLDECAFAFMQGAQIPACTGNSALHGELAHVPSWFRGFAYEGAGMSAHILDRLVPGRGWRLPLLLSGPGYRYRHLIHVGVGWGMSRLHQLHYPITTWGLDPLLRWLALDGIGFHDLFFAPRTHRQEALDAPIRNSRAHVVRQGMGRALWFVHGADPAAIAAAIGGCSPTQKNALWRGVGLAAGYAGGSQARPQDLLELAGQYRPSVRQGLRFASAARHAHGHSTSENFSEVVGRPDECAELATRNAIPLTVRSAGSGNFHLWQASLEGHD